MENSEIKWCCPKCGCTEMIRNKVIASRYKYPRCSGCMSRMMRASMKKIKEMENQK